jgi:hypothetical protein
VYTHLGSAKDLERAGIAEVKLHATAHIETAWSRGGMEEIDTVLMDLINSGHHSILLIFVVWPPLWSSGQSSWLQIQRSEFDSRCYQIF